MGPCHHSMVRSHVTDGEDGLQIRYVAASIFNEQSQTAHNKWYSNLWVGQWAKTSCHINTYITKYYT